LQITQARGKWIISIEGVSASHPCTLCHLQGVCAKSSLDVEDKPLIKDDWSFAASKSCWTNNKMGNQWLVNPLTLAKPCCRRLLIVNGHGSHITAKFATDCFKHNTDPLIMPVHCSHKLQLLDIALFRLLRQQRWS
jgi:hypothetical protein